MKKKVWSFSLIIFLVGFLVFFSCLTPKQVLSSQIEGIRAPLYWSVYEYCFTTDGFIPEEEWEANINWIENNFRDYGYNTICIDGWGDVSSFNKNGYRTSHSTQWTHDYAWWSANLESRGMELGMYNNPLWVIRGAVDVDCKVAGTDIPLTDIVDIDDGFGCSLWECDQLWVQVDKPGAEEYVKGYIKFYADMGVEYLRVDFLSWYEDGWDKNLGVLGKTDRPIEHYQTALKWMGEACDEYGVFLSLVMPHLKNHGENELKYARGNMIRINEDTGNGGWGRFSDMDREMHHDWWSQYYNAFDGFIHWSDISGLGDRQMILDGDFIRLNTFKNDDERKTVVSLMLVAGGCVTIADRYNTIEDSAWIYQNTELLALNSDGFVGKPFSKDPLNVESQKWKGQMSNGDWVVGLFNREDEVETRSINFMTDLGIAGNVSVRDLWEHEDLGVMTSFSANLEPHSCVMLKIVPADKVDYASNPSPSTGVGNVGLEEELSWTAGVEAISHKVYFGTDPILGTEHGYKTEAYKGEQKETAYDPGTLAYGTTYYWRIDEVYPDGIVMGRFFRFTTEYDKVFPQDIINSDFETGNINEWKAKGSYYGVDSWDVNSGEFKCYFWGTNPYKQSIYQTVKGLDNGSYTIKAWIKQNTGIPNACSMIVRDFGGTKQVVDVPHGDEYKEYSITVEVLNGQLVVEFYTDSPGGSNMQIDDVELIKN